MRSYVFHMPHVTQRPFPNYSFVSDDKCVAISGKIIGVNIRDYQKKHLPLCNISNVVIL